MSSPRPYTSTLWYRQPAARWEEALPIGNGQLGAMVFGGVREERIQWNADTLWSGFPRDTNNYEALRHLAAARELIASRRYVEAEKLIEGKMVGRSTESFLPLGDLIIEHGGLEGEWKDYCRELNLDTGIISTRFRCGETTYNRHIWISEPDQVAAIRYTSDRPDGVNLNVRYDSPLAHRIRCENDALVLYGQAPTHIADNYHQDHPGSVLYEEGLGIKYEMQLTVRTEGGQADIHNGCIRVAGATSVTLWIAAATDFAGYDQMPGTAQDSARLCRERIQQADRLGYEAIRSRHLEEHQAMFRRVELSLGKGNETKSEIPTDDRMKAYLAGNPDPELEALMFQYGRYLLIASSRPGTQPAHLQGIWNPHVQPPWNSDYTININTEMNYWPAETTNLSECHEPLIQLIRELSQTGARTAKIHYHARGWVAHHNVDLWRMATPSDGRAMWAFWPLGGAWLSRHLWEHYQFNPDSLFLRDTAYPLMRDAALFCLDWLIEDDSGHLTTTPSTSPENQFLTEDGTPCSVSAGSTMDMAIIRDLFQHCIAASVELDCDSDLREEWQRAIDRLLPYAIDAEGRLMEWSENFPEAEPGHRHVSHLFGLYPGEDISLRHTPQLAEAAYRTLLSRISHGGGHTGWSCVWLINLFARLEQPEMAYTYIRTLLSRSMHVNLLGDHPPFQIDANFGATAGVAEMLLQSHHGEIHLLPSLPDAWSSGAVRGLKARGGFVIDMQWNEGNLGSAQIISTHGLAFKIRYKDEIAVHVEDGSELPQEEDGAYSTTQGVTYYITRVTEGSRRSQTKDK
ncbi:glycoside hydrolase family 95 protein [Paenibacillus sp. JCM 10914]|uniref:glycoside hydrolase family 95 protein n=1 Tax=Paenibacillus sp. JCM 10914 TaxID=1236974 RepID=UPI0003CC8ADF|nr:glycoside hydrolase family 95 protein [Paenibacillus sp. JCM 10914]GAE09068.1 putative large secreted protein [Paenibacillus sp. JCM 10914]